MIFSSSFRKYVREVERKLLCHHAVRNLFRSLKKKVRRTFFVLFKWNFVEFLGYGKNSWRYRTWRFKSSINDRFKRYIEYSTSIFLRTFDSILQFVKKFYRIFRHFASKRISRIDFSTISIDSQSLSRKKKQTFRFNAFVFRLVFKSFAWKS